MYGDRKQCLDAGCDDYMTKPLNPEDLIAMVGRHIKSGPSPGKVPEDFLSVRDAADRAAVSETTIRKACLKGLLKNHRLGKGETGSYRIKPEDLEAYIQDMAAQPSR